MTLQSIGEEATACRKRWEGHGVGALARCLHHQTHFELLDEPAEDRIKYILTTKERDEQALRLHSFGPWTATVPVNITEIHTARKQAETAWERTAQFQEDHARLFPDCPWDGKSIFADED